MKYVSVVALAGIALLLAGCGKSEPDLDDSKVVDKLLEDALEESKLQKRGPVGEQLAYAPNEQQPYTGWVKSMHPNGQVESLGSYKDGELHGLSTAWDENGQKKIEGPYKDGEFHGLTTQWHENGQKRAETTFKDGELHGLFVWWHENGQKAGEVTFKDGKKDGLGTEWDKNGNVTGSVTWKDGEFVK